MLARMSFELSEQGRPSYWRLLADKLQREPALIKVARNNITRWREQGHSALQRLNEWDGVLLAAENDPKGMQHLLSVLLDTNEDHERLRDFSPFAGVLTREERRRARELCGFRQ